MRIGLIHLLCLVLAIVCFLLAAFQVPARVSWQPLGFAFVTAAFLPWA